ncbi:NAD-binding protein [Rickenella mellea]|uniref:NAD-binding protein n=1 Tax=Rickenella mellea TaxID=50990 RepID=A0A4Y7PMX4_9AGAM|nr:NAD-binding protein [Rickenella mellea]
MDSIGSILVFGASGYVGGSVLVALRKKYPDALIKAFIRSPEQAEAIRAAGANPIIGTFGELDKVADLSHDADIVLQCADSDNVELITAILRGMKRRKDEGKRVGSLIHTSGTAIFLDGSKTGKFDPNGKIWNDSSIEDIKSITTSMWHGPVDVPILKAGEEGYVNTYIICPPGIYGRGSGPVSRNTLIYRFWVNAFRNAHAATIVGEGSNTTGMVHIDDLVDFFLIIFGQVLAGEPKSNAYERYFVPSSFETTAKSVISIIAKVLHAHGIVDSPEVKSVTFEEAGQIGFFTSNTRVKGDRARTMGWIPKFTSPLDVVGEDMDAALAEGL